MTELGCAPLASMCLKHVSKIGGILVEEFGGTRFSMGIPNCLLSTLGCRASEEEQKYVNKMPYNIVLPFTPQLHRAGVRMWSLILVSHLHWAGILGWLASHDLCPHTSCAPSSDSLHDKCNRTLEEIGSGCNSTKRVAAYLMILEVHKVNRHFVQQTSGIEVIQAMHSPYEINKTTAFSNVHSEFDSCTYIFPLVTDECTFSLSDSP